MFEHQGHDLAERERKGTLLRNDLFPTVQRSVRCLVQRHLEALMNVAFEAKGWMVVQKRHSDRDYCK